MAKKILIAAAVTVIFLVGVRVGLKLDEAQTSPPLPPVVEQKGGTVGRVEIADQSSPKIPASPPAPPKGEAGGDLFIVTRAIDGDTIEIEGGERVRYIGIDTPETIDPRIPVQCFGVEASKKNKELVEGKLVRLEKDIIDRDKYRRLLRYVHLGDVFVNLELVKQGFAYSYSRPPDIKYQDQLTQAQEEARQANRGLWGACPPKRELEKAAPASIAPASSEAPKGNPCLIKGNVSASGEKIYHLPSCGSYSKTVIDEIRGDKWFCTETEAEISGWRKALNCP